MQRVTYFDGLRGIACMQVVLYHCGYENRLGIAANGQVAVDLFFLMSGFVLTASFAKPDGNIQTKFLRRLWRLGVPSIIAICTSAILSILSGQTSTVSGALFETIIGIAQCATLHLVPVMGQFTVITLDPPLWTIVFETYGSILLLVLVAAQKKAPGVHFWAIVLALSVPGINLIALFVIGHVAAHMTAGMSQPVWLRLPAMALIFAGVALSRTSIAGANPAFFHPLFMRSFSPNECGATMIFFGVLMAPFVQIALNTSLTQFLGKLSFSIYLLHTPVRGFVVTACHGQGILVNVTSIALTISAAVVFERYVDAPAVRMARMFRSKKWPPTNLHDAAANSAKQ